MIYQMHPEHGRHISFTGAEESSNIKNGWATVTEDEFYGGLKKESSRDELVKLYVLKFDKKPPHNMKPENIQAKLDE